MLNKTLKVIRQYHQVSISTLSFELSIPKEDIARLENGLKLPTLDILNKYSSYFDIPVSSLVFFSETLGSQGKVSKRLRLNLAGKILNVLEWVTNKNGATD